MDELEKIFKGEGIGGEYEDFKKLFVNDEKNQREFYDDLRKEQKTDLGYDQFKSKYFTFTPTAEGEKKKTTPEQGVGSPVSQPQSKTASVVTPQSKPAVSPATPKYQYGNEPAPVNPVAKTTPLPGLGGAPMDGKQRETGEITQANFAGKSSGEFLSNPYGRKKYELGKHPELTYTKKPDGSVVVKGTYGTMTANDNYWEATEDGGFNYIGPRDIPSKDRPWPLAEAESRALGTDQDDETSGEPKMGYESVPSEMRPGSGVLSEKEQRDRSYSQHFGPRLSYSRERDEPKGLSGEMGEVFDKFQKYRNQATIAAQKNTMDEAAGNIEYKKSQRDPNPDWAEQRDYALEDAQAAERAKVVSTQPLVSKMLDYYDVKAGDTEWEDNRLVKALSYTSPPAALLAGGPGGMFAGDRDDSPVVALKEQLIGTPEGAALEQELQKIYKRTNLKDQTSVDNALLDAKQLMFEKLADKDVTIWDDFAQTNKAMADYNPTAYHARTRGKMEKQYAAAGIDKSLIDSKLMDHSLNRGVMDEERTAEAKAVMNLRTIKDEVSRAEREGSAFRIDQAKQKLAAAEKEVQVMESKRLSALDSKIEEIQNAIVTETDPKKIEIYKKGLNLVKAQRAGFINPNAQVMAAYAKVQDQADAVSPQGTPMQKLQKLYAELEFDRQEIMGRIQQAEAKFGGAGLAANEILNSLPGNAHNDDHKLLLRTEAQLKDLAPIVFLNENPAVQDKKDGLVPSFNTAFNTTFFGDGSMFSNTHRQEDAINLYRNLQIGGVPPEVLNDPTMMGIKDRMDDPGLDSWNFWGTAGGASTGIMLPLIATTVATRGIGLPGAIGRAVQIGNRALGLTGKYSGAILPLLGDAIESGINYELAGRYVSVHNEKELDFLGGFLGGAASSFGSGAFTTLKKSVTGMFGNKAQEAANMFVNFGASRLGAGTGELSEEFGQQIGQLWQESSTGQEFWKRMEEQFGEFDEASKFVVSTMVLGMAMGGAHSGGFGEYLYELNQKKLNELPPKERTRVQPVIDQLQDEQLALVEGTLNSTPEDVASVEAEQEGIEPEKKKQELTPEAQAAQAELERRAAIDKTMVEQGLGDRVNTAQSQEDRIREELASLRDQRTRQELTDNEKKRLADLETVVIGLDQIAAGEQFVSPAPEVETETIVTNSGDVIEAVEGSPTKKKVTLESGIDLEIDTDGLSELLGDGAQSVIEQSFAPTEEVVATEETPISPTPTEEAVVEENPFGEPTPREQPKRRDEQIVDQINEFFNGLAGAVSEGSKEQLKKYARRILAGEDPTKVMQGQSARAVELVNEVVKQIQNEVAPDTDESIIDVTGEAPTPIAAEETVVAESPAPVTQKKGKGAAKGGKSKPKANPNRKTKSKPVADLTPTEVVSEAIAVNSEVDENPTIENQDRQVEIEERIENQIAPTNEVTTETEVVTESPMPAPKTKKSRGKQKPLPEGVEVAFHEATISGRRTSWMKKDGKWFFRNHKPGTKISEQQFERDWQEAKGKDIEKAERLAAMDSLDLNAINAAKEWVAAWGDFVKLKWGMKGAAFSRVDLGLADPIGKIMVQTVKLGVAVAKQLAAKGAYTKANWEEAMKKFAGDHVQPLLSSAWETIQAAFPEGSSIEQIEAVEEQAGEEANEKSKDVKKKSGRQATADTMREFSETNPAALNAALAAVDDTYEVMSIKGIFAEALAAVKKAGGFANPDVWADLISEKEGEAKVLHHAKRMLAIRFYGELADQIQERMGDEATQEEMEAFEKAVANMEVALDLVKNNNTWSGQQTSMMAEWRMVMANTVGYVKSKIEKYNADILKSPKKGKAIKRKAKETKEQLNDIREQAGTTIDAAAAVDAAITDVENGTTPKAKKTREGGKPKTRIVKALGLNAAEADAMMAQALADMSRAAREGFAGSMGSPAVFSFANALGRYGVAVMAKGAITFKEWAAKIKGDIPNVTDQQLRDVWDTHEHDGKTLAEHSKEALAAAAAAPVARTAARKQSLRGKIRGAINDHFKKGAEPMTLEERLLAIKDEAGNQLLTEDEAAHIYESVKGELEVRVKAKVEARAKALKRKPKKESKPAKTDSQRAIEAMVDEEFTDEMVQEIFADRLGLMQEMTPEQVKTARALGKALSSTKPNTRSEANAAMALDRFMYEILPPPSNGALYGELFKSIIYANMLMGIPTHLKNLITSGAMTVSSFVETAFNPAKWKRAVRVAIKKGKETGDWTEASWLFLQASPITELMVKTRALARGWSKGARIAWDIMKSGYIDSKYIDQGKAKLGRLSPILERHRFGKYNPANIFKYVGRALSAEDAWMYAMNNEMELADATRRHFLDGKSGGAMALTRDVSRRMAKSNPLYATSLAEAEADIDKISDALQMTPAEKARAIKIRAREILIDKIGLTEDEVQQAEDTARSRIFTMKRNGLWGKTATLMTKINNTKGIGAVSWIWMPFANIIGNLGDTFNDYYPGYGILRANGVSPTALAAMLSESKESAMMSEPIQAEGAVDWIKKTMGGRQDQRYYEQMGRAWLGSMMMLTAMMLMDDDDKDDFIQFTGKNDPTHKNYLKIGGIPIISWELIPSVAPVAAIMSEAHSFHKLHPKEDRSFGRRMLYAMGAVEQSVAGLSVAESVQNLNQVVGTALSSLTGVGNYGDPVDFEKGITTLGTELGKSGIGMLSRVNPLTNPLVGQIQQILDPRVFSHSTIEQSMEYAALGVTYRYTKDAEGNDRIAGVDIFGEEIKRLPSEDSFGFLSMFANEKAKDPRWKFLADHGGLEVMSRTTNANILFEDDEEKYGVVSRKMTDKQYGTYAKLAGQKFSKELTKYMNGNQWKKDYDTVVMGTAGTMTKLQEEVKKMASEARTKAKDEMDRMPESKGGFGGTRIGTKTYVKP